MTGSLEGALQGALWGAVSAGVAFGVGETLGHAGGIFTKGVKSGQAFIKAAAHGLSRGIISMAQGGTFKSGFASGFSASFFSPGTTMGGDGAGGFGLRTTIAAITGGTASALGGGKFANGAISGAFVHMFNAEGKTFIDGVKSIGTGLKRFGDYLARVSGFRDWQEGSIILGNYYQEQALQQTSNTYQIAKYIVTNSEARSLATNLAQYYIEKNPGYVAGRALAIPIGTLGRAPVPIMATSGDITYTANQIDSFVRGIVYGY
ncbi:MAG: hypothetical protein PHS85_10280 [Sulfurovum sp.]|nr:hypothetical protein [Sulfurovum sp.]